MKAEAVATGSVKEWLNNPSLAFKAEGDWPDEVPKARVHIAPEHIGEVVHTLWKRNVVVSIDEERIFRYKGKKVLGGLFGVERPQDPVTPLGPSLRVVMNLIPLNSFLKDLCGDVGSLPMTAQWLNFVLLEDEIVWVNSEDQKSSFYLYELPEAW